MIGDLLSEPGAVLAGVPVAALTFLVVAAGAGLAVLRGLATDRRALARCAPLLLGIVGASGAVWLRTRGALADAAPQLIVAAAVTALLAWHVLRDDDAGAAAAPPPAAGRSRGAWALLAAGLLAFAALTWHLATYAASTLVWESPVTSGFGEAFYEHTGTLAYAARALVWNEGLVSNGNESFLYGAPTYALLSHAGFSTLSLRAFAALWALLLVAALWAFTRRHFGADAAALAALVLAANTYVIFYGRYGTSLSATLLACAAAALAAGELVSPERATWWRGLVAGAALYVATLEYSPGRLVVIALLASLVPAAVRAWRGRRRRALTAFAALAVAMIAVVAAQRAAGGQRSFLNARGEQLYTILTESDYVRDYLAQDSPAFDTFARWARRLGLARLVPTPAELAAVPRKGPFVPTPAERLEVTFKVLAGTVPQCTRLLSPFTMTSATDQSIFDDPPAIKAYFAPLAAFTLLGFLVSLRRSRQWGHAVLLGWFAVTVLPVLLTTRCDAHRTALLAVPLPVWTALGALEAGRAAARLGVPRRARAVLGASLGALLLIGTWSVVLRQQTDDGIQTRLLAAVAKLPGPVVVGALIDLRERAWIELGLLERTRRDGAAPGRMLDAALREGLAHPESSWPADLLDRAEEVCAHATLVLAPAAAYGAAVARLEARGLGARELRLPGLRAWLIPRRQTAKAAATAPAPPR